MERRKPPQTVEGWYVLHDLRRIDWDAWRAAPERERERALEEAVEYLQAHERLADAEEGASAVYSVIGHKADFMMVHLRPTTAHLDRAERAFEGTAFAEFTERATSYVSVTEMSGYVHEDIGDGVENIEDPGMRNYIANRLHPELPDAEHVCFYPMDKSRGPDANWYDLPFDERAELMSGHGDIGRDYAGKVSQIISGSVGFDDYEWGVTLFAEDAVDIKHLLYEMRFDPSSSRFAEFGPFYFGRKFDPTELPALLAGEPVGEGAAEHAGSHAGGHSHENEAADDREGADESASSAASAGGRPSVPDEPPHDVVNASELERELSRVAVDLTDHPEAGYGLVFSSTEDAETLVEDVQGLAGNFDHYDTHVLTTVRGDKGRSTVVSLWKNERAANTASGFLSGLEGVERGIGAELDAEEGVGGAGAGVEGTDEDDELRGELTDLDIYAGKPHGEDVYAMVVYSEADSETVDEAVSGLAERFDHYDTHVKTAVYDAAERGRVAVVSLWKTRDAAEKAGGFLADIPGVVARAGEESGFGTMGMFYTVKPEYRDEFVDRFETVGGLLAEMEGHLETDLMVNVDDENDMFIASQWTGKEDALSFFRSDAFRETVQWGREVLADRPRHVFLA
ncbi:heme-binding protein [Natronomonas sp. EA1]|uniref:heme-binding protein n=1 Tax=Natronomonas sp. EA1 TaxID=3421655 RepID=UPI003EB720EE